MQLFSSFLLQILDTLIGLQLEVFSLTHQHNSFCTFSCKWTHTTQHCGPMHRPICSDQLPVKYRSSIGHVTLMYRSSIGHISVEYRWSKTISVYIFIGRLSTDSRPIVGRQSIDISADVSAGMSTEATYSIHDPSCSVSLLCGDDSLYLYEDAMYRNNRKLSVIKPAIMKKKYSM